MRSFAIAILTVGLLASAPTVASAQETMQDLGIAQCIRDNAPAVEQAVGSLNDAVDFLTRKVCAVPVTALAERMRSEATRKWSDQMKANCLRMKANSAKPNDNSNSCDTNFDATTLSLFAARGSVSEAVPADMTALAAKLLLDLRLAHMNKTH